MSAFDYVLDPQEYERIAVPENYTGKGYFVCSVSGVSIEEKSVAEYALIQKFVSNLGYAVTLKEAEYLWSTHCQNHFYAKWKAFEPNGEQFTETVRRELKIRL